MKASELIAALQRLQGYHGDLDVVAHVVSENQVFSLDTLVEYDQFEPDGPGYLVVATTGSDL